MDLSQVPFEPYYRDEHCVIYNADCRDIVPYLPMVNATITDPPYGIGKQTGTINKRRGKNLYATFDDTPGYVQTVVVPVFQECLNRSERAVVTTGFSCLWDYPRATTLGMVYQPCATGMTSWGRGTCQPVLFYGKDPRAGKAIEPIHIQITKGSDFKSHPCPKPIELARWMVKRGSLEGETILDPFAGSMTIAEACKIEGRFCIAIEINEAYCEKGVKRLEQGVLF